MERTAFDGKLASNSHFDKVNVPYKAAHAHPEHGGMYTEQCTILRVRLITVVPPFVGSMIRWLAGSDAPLVFLLVVRWSACLLFRLV